MTSPLAAAPLSGVPASRPRLRALLRAALCIAALGALLRPAAVRADELGDRLQGRANNLIIDVGYRYPFSGQGRIPGDGFPVTYHAAVSSMVNLAWDSGLYLGGRVDGFAPRGDGVPLMGQFRIGYFSNVHTWDQGGIRQSTSDSTQCTPGVYSAWCTTTRTTRQWYEPPGWISGVTYMYAGYRQGFQFLGDVDPRTGRRERAYPGAVGLGVGWIETKFATFTNEIELFYWPFGWKEEGRSKWGFQYRGAILLGPVFVDFTGVLDAAIGGEVSVGLGVMLAP
jgi:hypothetical protein